MRPRLKIKTKNGLTFVISWEKKNSKWGFGVCLIIFFVCEVFRICTKSTLGLRNEIRKFIVTGFLPSQEWQSTGLLRASRVTGTNKISLEKTPKEAWEKQGKTKKTRKLPIGKKRACELFVTIIDFVRLQLFLHKK